MTPEEIQQVMCDVRRWDERSQVEFLSNLEADETKEARSDTSGRPASPLDLGKLVFRQAFQDGRHTRYLNAKLLEVSAGKVDRLLVTMPPRHFSSRKHARTSSRPGFSVTTPTSE